MPNWVKNAAHILTLTVAFFSIGLLTRIPALYFSEIYALHALLASPFYAILVGCYLETYKKIYPVAAAIVIYGAYLGSMHFIMALGAIAPLLFTLGVYFLLLNSDFEKRVFFAATIYASLGYPITVLSGLSFGNYHLAWSSEQIIFLILYCIVSISLGVIGALLGIKIASSLSKQDPSESR